MGKIVINATDAPRLCHAFISKQSHPDVKKASEPPAFFMETLRNLRTGIRSHSSRLLSGGNIWLSSDFRRSFCNDFRRSFCNDFRRSFCSDFRRSFCNDFFRRSFFDRGLGCWCFRFSSRCFRFGCNFGGLRFTLNA